MSKIVKETLAYLNNGIRQQSDQKEGKTRN